MPLASIQNKFQILVQPCPTIETNINLFFYFLVFNVDITIKVFPHIVLVVILLRVEEKMRIFANIQGRNVNSIEVLMYYVRLGLRRVNNQKI